MSSWIIPCLIIGALLAGIVTWLNGKWYQEKGDGVYMTFAVAGMCALLMNMIMLVLWLIRTVG